MLPFAQLDLPGELALADSRYLVRPPGEAEARPDVLVIRTLGAPRSRARLRRRKPQPVATPEIPPLPLSRVTVIKALPFSDRAAAEEWLKRVSGDDELARGLTSEVTTTVNRALQAHRVAAPEPYAADIHPGAAVAVRFGFGSGEEVAEGRWSEARELSEARRRSLRAETLDGVGAQERVAAVLGGRSTVGVEESLLIDAERAHREGRPQLAAITLAAAADALARTGGGAGEAQGAASRLRERALGGEEVDDPALRKALRTVRRAVRARS
jgi:hypothetical protein